MLNRENPIRRFFVRYLPADGVLLAVLVWLNASADLTSAADPPTIDPFGPKPAVRDDAIPGYVELSNGTIRPGQIYLTRDKRLKILDQQLNRQREIPLRAVAQIECRVKRQWTQNEWKFKESANDEKIYTGRRYRVQEYIHTITLHDGRTVTGPLSALVYVQSDEDTVASSTATSEPAKPERYVLHKRQKGKMGRDPRPLVYVERIKLGEEALREGRKKAAARHSAADNLETDKGTDESKTPSKSSGPSVP
jgi:hypothetical protein